MEVNKQVQASTFSNRDLNEQKVKENVKIQCDYQYNVDLPLKIQDNRQDSFLLIDDNSKWTYQQRTLFCRLYEVYGPSWQSISASMVNKTQADLKNKFNNALRKVVCILYKIQTNFLKRKKVKRESTQIVFLALLDFSNQIYRTILNMNKVPNLQNFILQFRSEFIRLILVPELFQKQQLIQFIIKSRNLSTKIRCFGVFKVNHRKQWKISQKSFNIYCQMDQTILQTVQTYPNPEENQSPPHSLFTFPQFSPNQMYFFERFNQNYNYGYNYNNHNNQNYNQNYYNYCTKVEGATCQQLWVNQNYGEEQFGQQVVKKESGDSEDFVQVDAKLIEQDRNGNIKLQ